MTVLLTWSPTAEELALVRESWPSELETLRLDQLNQDELASRLADVEVMVGYMRSIPQLLLADAPQLRLLHVLGHGVDGLLTEEVLALARERELSIARSNPCGITIAEFTIANMVSLSRRIVQLHGALTARGDWSTDLWARRGEGVLGGELHGSTLGLIGYGNIGHEIHIRASAFGMEVGSLARRPDSLTGAGLSFVDPWHRIDEFLGRCDYVVLSLPLTPETKHLIDGGRIAAMRRGSYLVNISRGLLVAEDALWQGLSSGHLAGAAIDVFELEEEGQRAGYPAKRPLHQFNTVLTPHIAGATAEARTRALTTVGENLRRLYAGEELLNLVQLEKGF